MKPGRFVVSLVVASALLGSSQTASAAPRDALQGRPRMLYVTNSDSGTVAMFTVDRLTGRLTPAARPVPAGTNTRGVVVSPNGRFAYVVSSGTSRVLSYRIDGSGLLIPTGEATVDGEPFGLALAPDGRTLYAGVQGTATVTSFTVGSDGRLSQLGAPVSVGEHPRGIAVSPNGRFLYVTQGTEPDALATFAIRPDGRLKPHGSPAGIGVGGGHITISADSRFLYVTDQFGNQLYGFRIGADGDLTPVPGSPLTATNDPEGIAITPDGRHVYLTATGLRPEPPTDGNLQGFRTRDSGALESITPTPVAAGVLPVALTPSPDGRHLFVASQTSNEVRTFAIGPNGALRQVGAPITEGINAPASQATAVTPDQGPMAKFTAAVRPAGTPSTFDATESTDPDGQVQRYDWDFGDGTALPNGGVRPSHVFARPGTYRVTLKVTDNEGCADRLVFTGQSALCNGTPQARAERLISLPQGPAFHHRS